MLFSQKGTGVPPAGRMDVWNQKISGMTSGKIKLAAPDSADFILDDYPLYNLNRTSATYVNEMTKVLKSVGTDQPQWRILMLLADQSPSTVSELSRRGVTKMSTITRILIRMEDEGLVRRSPSPVDSRVTEVFITDKGAGIVDDLRTVATRVYRKAFEGLEEGEVRRFVEILKIVRDNLTRSPYLD